MAGPHSYAQAGVRLEAGREAIARMASAVRRTHGPEVLGRPGGFGGMFALGQAVLVATTDGVGTKALLAAQLGCYRGLGHDLVNHCLNDLLCQGARPLFFLDYIAFDELEPATAAELVEGMAEACQAAGVALLGGETAEMPDTYLPGALDVVGTMVGLVSPEAVLRPERVRAGDVLVGLPSSGLHTNGFSLVRRLFANRDPEAYLPELGCSLAEELLRPHRSYLGLVPPAAHALAHITGGGLVENVPRLLPPGLAARLDWGSWPVPPIFDLIQRLGEIADEEMLRVFNMGLGMVAALPAGEVGDGLVVGEVVAGEGQPALCCTGG